MTAALECLHNQHPGRFVTDVQTSCDAVFANNPHVTKLYRHDRVVDMEYNLINQADSKPCHFLQGFVEHLSKTLDIPLECNVKRPYLYLSDDERERPQPEPYWLLNAGWKDDYPVKKWKREGYQAVVNHFAGRINFVQVGLAHHHHHKLLGVKNLIGKTDDRQFVRWAYHAEGCLTPESYLHHVAAAFEKPCVTLASGFLPVSWVQYKTGVILSHGSKMSCCAGGKGCWKGNWTQCPFKSEGDVTAKCMTMIAPDEVIRAIEAYYEGGLINSV